MAATGQNLVATALAICHHVSVAVGWPELLYGMMTMNLLETLRDGLVVSCQPVDDGPMNRPDIVPAMAAAAVARGADGLRIECVANLAAVRPLVSVPIIAILKRDLKDSPVRITPFVADVQALAEAQK